MDAKEKARLKKYEKTYGTEGAKVRNRIFKRILKNKQDGTKAGQWSARKAQSLVEEYEEAMGEKGKKAYKSGKKTKSQKSLKKWGDQKWKTKSGQDSSKTGERYLPEKAIKALTDKEYKKTSDKKRQDTKKGKQFSDQPKEVAKKVAKYRSETFEAKKRLNLPLSFSTYSVNSAFCIASDPQYSAGLCYDETNHKVDRTGNIRGSHGAYGSGEPSCVHCKRVWKKMNNEEKEAWKKAFIDWNDEYYNEISFDAETFEAEDNSFNWGDTGLEEHFGFVQFIPKRDRQMPTHVIYRDNPTETGMRKKTMCGIYLKGKNADFNVGWPNHLPLHPEHKSGGCKKCYEIMSNMLNKKSAETFDAERGSTPRKHHRTEDWGEDVDWEDGDDSTSEKNRRPKEWDDVDWNAERFASELYNPKIGTYITTDRHYQLLDTNKAIKAMKRNGVGLFWNTAYSDQWDKEIEIYPVKKITEIRAGDEIALHGPVEVRVLWVNPETRYQDDGKGGQKRINGYAMELEVTKLPPNPTNPHWPNLKISKLKVGDIIDKFVPQGGGKIGMTHLSLAKGSWEESAAEWNAEEYYQVYLYYGGEYPNEIRYARTFREARDIEYRSGAEHSEIVNPQGNVVDSQTGKEYPPLVFDAESRPRSVEIKRSSNPEKKLMAVFEDKDGKKIKTTHFGQRGASDYTKHGEKERMQRYLERHGGGTTTSTKENWKDPTTAGALSRWVLWNKPSLSGSFSNFKSRFGLKGDLKVSKSAETSQVESNNQIQFYSGVVLGLGAFLALRSYFRDEE